MSGAYDRVVAALEGHGSKRRGDMFTCPAHEDSSPSLSVKVGDDGRALVHCFAGCETADVLEAVGLGLADLFDGPMPKDWMPPPPPPSPRVRIGLPTEDDLYWAAVNRGEIDHEATVAAKAARWRPASILDGVDLDALAPQQVHGGAVSAVSAESPPPGPSEDHNRANRANRASKRWPAPMAPEAFHGLAGEFVRLVEPHTEADPAALLVDFLGIAGHAIGRTAHVRVGAAEHYPHTYAVVVGASGAGGRKGTAYTEALPVFRMAAPEAAARAVGGVTSGEGIIWNVRDPIFKRDKDGEEVQVDPGVADKRLLLREAEFSQVLRVASRDSNTTSVTLREAWDGAQVLQTLAKNSPVTATGASVSMLADITPDELRRELTATDKANGFANRILWCCSRRSKVLPDGGRVNPDALGALAARLGGVLADAHLLGPVARDEDARALWRDVYGDLTRERPGMLGALLARAEAQAVRLSLIYAVLDGAQTIGREHLEAALAVWDYCERSAAYIFGDALGDPTADELLDALRRSPKGMTRNEIRDYFGRHRSSAEIGRALALLERQGRARLEREPTAGRPSERWYAMTTEGGAS